MAEDMKVLKYSNAGMVDRDGNAATTFQNGSLVVAKLTAEWIPDENLAHPEDEIGTISRGAFALFVSDTSTFASDLKSGYGSYPVIFSGWERKVSGSTISAVTTANLLTSLNVADTARYGKIIFIEDDGITNIMLSTYSEVLAKATVVWSFNIESSSGSGSGSDTPTTGKEIYYGDTEIDNIRNKFPTNAIYIGKVAESIEDQDGTISVSTPLDMGWNTLGYILVSKSGAESSTVTRRVLRKNNPPEVEINVTTPVTVSTLGTFTVVVTPFRNTSVSKITVKTEKTGNIQEYVNSSTKKNEIKTFSVSIPSPDNKLNIGNNYFTIIAYQSDGLTTTKRICVVRNVGDPTLVITDPPYTNTTIINKNSYVITGEATANAIEYPIDYVTVNGHKAEITRITQTKVTFSYNFVGFTTGANTLTIKAVDMYGKFTTKTIRISRALVRTALEVIKPESNYVIVSNPTTEYTITGKAISSNQNYLCKKVTISKWDNINNVWKSKNTATLTKTDLYTMTFSFKDSKLDIGTNMYRIESTYGDSSSIDIKGHPEIITIQRASVESMMQEKDHNYVEFSILRFNTTATFYYEGDIDAGIVIHISALEDQIGDIQINNITDPNVPTKIGISVSKINSITGHPFTEGDEIIISTHKGNKYVRLYRDGVYTNILGCLKEDPDWFQLTPGYNTFNFTSTNRQDYLDVVFEYRKAYSGI